MKQDHNFPFSLEDLKALYKPRSSPLTFVPSVCLKVSSEQYSKLEYPLPVAVKGRKQSLEVSNNNNLRLPGLFFLQDLFFPFLGRVCALSLLTCVV